MMLSGAMAGNVAINMAGIMAKYFATSFAMLNVVSEPRVISICFPISTMSMQLGRIAVEVDHVAGFARGLRAGVHRHADIGLRKRGRVVRAIAGHGDEMAVGLFLGEYVSAFCSGVACAMKSSTPASAAMAAAVSGLSPVIITVLIPILRSCANRSLIPPLTTSLSSIDAEGHRCPKRRRAGCRRDARFHRPSFATGLRENSAG